MMRLKDTTDAWSIFILRVQNLCRIKQRKWRCIIQAVSDDVDDRDDEYDRGIIFDRDAQNLSRIKQRKQKRTFASLRHRVMNEDDKDDDLITPYTYQEIPFPSVSTTPEQPPVDACVPICAILSKKSEKYPPQGIQGLNWRFQRNCFSNCEMPTLCSKFALH